MLRGRGVAVVRGLWCFPLALPLSLYLSPSCPSYSFNLWSCFFGYLSQSVVSESVESCPIRETRVGEVILLFGLVSVFPFKSWVSLLLVRWSLGDSVLQISLFFSYFFFSLFLWVNAVSFFYCERMPFLPPLFLSFSSYEERP